MKYELTVTLKPSWYRLTAAEQFQCTREKMMEILKDYQVSCVADLTSANNIHYHALIELKDFVERDKLINKLRKYPNVFGRLTCTQLIHEPKWTKYLQDKISPTRLIIRNDPDIRDYFGIFGNMTEYFNDPNQ